MVCLAQEVELQPYDGITYTDEPPEVRPATCILEAKGAHHTVQHRIFQNDRASWRPVIAIRFEHDLDSPASPVLTAINHDGAPSPGTIGYEVSGVKRSAVVHVFREHRPL
jgi:hypothetical protein